MKITQEERFSATSTSSMFFISGLGFGRTFSMFHMNVESPPIRTGARRTLVIAACLGEVDGYTQACAGEDTNFAIYVKEEYITEGLSLSDVVSLAETTGTVSSVSRQELPVIVDNISRIASGASREPVYLNNAPIGFINGWNGRGSLRCISY